MIKLSNKVVTTSSAPYLVFRKAGTTIPTDPAAQPNNIIMGTKINAGASKTPVPTATAAIAPKYNWPSAPIFQSLARKANAAASPVNIKGVALVSISEKANLDPNTPLAISTYEIKTGRPQTKGVSKLKLKPPAQIE